MQAQTRTVRIRILAGRRYTTVAMMGGDNTGGVEETVKIARMLLKYGADPLEEDKDGDTPLKCAEHGTEQQEMIDLLREAMKLCSSDRCWWEERIGLWL